MIDLFEAVHKQWIQHINESYQRGYTTLRPKEGKDRPLKEVKYLVDGDMIFAERVIDENNEPQWVYIYKKYVKKDEENE